MEMGVPDARKIPVQGKEMLFAKREAGGL